MERWIDERLEKWIGEMLKRTGETDWQIGEMDCSRKLERWTAGTDWRDGL